MSLQILPKYEFDEIQLEVSFYTDQILKGIDLFGTSEDAYYQEKSGINLDYETIRQNEAFEALLLDSHGMVPEASKANVFGNKDGTIITPPDEVILPGITRKYVLNACHDLGIPVEMRTFGVNEIKTMDGLFLTGTSIHVLPVCQVNQIKLRAKNTTISNIMKQLEKTIENHLG